MANIGKWNAPTLSTVLSTELNSLAINTMSAATAAIANQTNLDLFCDIEVNLASFSPGTGGYVVIYILLAVDGSNYPAQSDADLRKTTTQQLCTIPLGETASTAQRVAARNITLPPGSFKLKLDNQCPSGGTFAGSGNTLKLNIYDTNLNA